VDSRNRTSEKPIYVILILDYYFEKICHYLKTNLKPVLKGRFFQNSYLGVVKT